MWPNAILCITGVRIKKRNIERFTVALHGWDAVTEKDVYHAGQNFGTIRDSRSGDIESVETQHSFSSTLLDIDATARRLYHSSLLLYGDFVVMDSAFTLSQRMRWIGVQSGKTDLPPVM